MLATWVECGTTAEGDDEMQLNQYLRIVWVSLLCMLGISGCAQWKRFGYEGWSRDRWQQPEKVLTTLALQPGAQVADIGAGGGYFTFRLAAAVGPQGKVYAVDVDPDMTEYLSQRARDEKVDNVEVVLAQPDAPGLPPGSVDMLFTCNTYHHLDDPVAYFSQAKQSLRPGGRLAILDLNGSGWFSWFFSHATPAAKIRADMQSAGYELVAQPDFLREQNFLLFQATPPS